MKKGFIICTLVLMTAAGGGLATSATAAQQAPKPTPMSGKMERGWHHGRHGHYGRMEALANVLGLTKAQRTKIRGILRTEREKARPWMEQLRKDHRELRAATANGTFNEAKVRALAAKMAQARTDLMVSRLRVKSEIFATFTPAQQSLAKKLRPLLRHPRHFGDRF